MLKIAIVGATGIVGQQAIVSLIGHPWFKITKAGCFGTLGGKEIYRRLEGCQRFYRAGGAPKNCRRISPIWLWKRRRAFDPTSVDIIFSTMDAGPAKELEPKYAKTTPVISTASAFRYEDDTPILVGGVNMDHAALLAVQQKNRGWKGFISPKSNCTIAGLVVSLKPILDMFGVKQVMMTSLQAMSGAGRTPGLSAMDMMENVVPYISGEEPKVETEPQKILGKFTGNNITERSFRHYRRLQPCAGA